MDNSEDTHWCPKCHRLRPHAEMRNTPSAPISVWCVDCVTRIYPLCAQFHKENASQKPIRIKTERYFKVKQEVNKEEEKQPEPATVQEPVLPGVRGCDCGGCRSARARVGL